MSAPVDVLAVISLACEMICEHSPAGVRSPMATKLMEARAAVAELIAATKRVDAAFKGYPFHSDALEALRAALGRCAGGAQ